MDQQTDPIYIILRSILQGGMGERTNERTNEFIQKKEKSMSIILKIQLVLSIPLLSLMKKDYMLNHLIY